MTWKYRYRREVISDESWEARCNALGEAGWSLIGAPRWQSRTVEVDGPVAVGWLCFFKRTLSDREQLHALMRAEATPEQKAEIAATVARWRREDQR